MQNLKIIEHPVVKHYLGLLRAKSTQPAEFRRGLVQICRILFYEATKDLSVSEYSIDTPLENMQVCKIREKLAIVSILRAGLGMQEPICEVYPDVRLGHIGLFRKEDTLMPVKYYCKLPAEIHHSRVFLVDPMLATGGSLSASVKILREHKVDKIRCLTLVSAPEGIDLMQQHHPDVEIYTAAIDRCLNESGFILPGLGDAGDRIFATE